MRQAFEPVEKQLQKIEFDSQLAEADRLTAAGRPAEARTVLEQLESRAPGDPRVAERRKRVNALAVEGDIQAALPALRTEIEQGCWFKAESQILSFLEQSPAQQDLQALCTKLSADRAAFFEQVRRNPTVACYDNPNETYDLYLPPNYDPRKPIPVLYMHSAQGGPGGSVPPLVRKAGAHLPWMMVHVNNSRNGPWDDILRAQDEVLRDTEARYNLDPRRQFATGFSGGGRASFMMAFRYPRRVRGVLGMGAGLSLWNELPSSDLTACIMIGTKDSNYDYDVPRAIETLQKAGVNLLVRTYDGGHQHPDAALVREGLDWLDQNVQ